MWIYIRQRISNFELGKLEPFFVSVKRSAMKPIYFLCCFILIMTIDSCWTDIPKGKEISISGYIIDTVKNKRLPYAEIFLIPGKLNFENGTAFYGGSPLDSVQSDSSGNFSLHYITEEEKFDYALELGGPGFNGLNTYSYYVNTGGSNYVIDFNHAVYPLQHILHLQNIILKARELNYAKLHIKILSNPYDTLYVKVYTPYREFYLQYLLSGNQIDTTLLTRLLPEAANLITYNTLPLPDSTQNIRILTDTINATLTDTTVIDKTIKSIYHFPLGKY